MNTIIGIIGIFVFLYFVSQVLLASRLDVPQDASRDTKAFIKVIPKGYEYPYFLDGSGYAINVKEKKILIATQDRLRAYKLEQIKSCTHKKGGTESTVINSRNKEKVARILKRDVYNNSGIFIEFTDLAMPIFQIKFCNNKELQHSLKILQQFFEGTLA